VSSRLGAHIDRRGDVACRESRDVCGWLCRDISNI
jgi:hypothetical protein